MRYRTPGGWEFALTRSTLEEWATAFGYRLRALGCSDEYVAEVQQQIRDAEEVGLVYA